MLTQENMESELSYAFLHAIAARGGFACESAPRHADNAAVDAVIREDGRKLADDSVLTSFTVEVQLKATFQEPTLQNGRYSYSLKIPQYDKLRHERTAAPRFLAVLFLPLDAAEWLHHSEECLVLKRCAYWVSLRGAPDSPNAKYQTVFIPKKQLLSLEGLTDIMRRASRREEIRYEP